MTIELLALCIVVSVSGAVASCSVLEPAVPGILTLYCCPCGA